jgi:hypothetical protein
MIEFNIDDKVMYGDKLCKVTHVYDDGAVKLQSIRGKSKCVYFRVPIEYIKKESDKNEQI